MWSPPTAALSALLLLHTAAYSMMIGVVWPKSSTEPLSSGTTENNHYLGEKVIGRRKRTAEPTFGIFGIFNEIRNAIEWLNEPFTAEDIQELTQLASGLENGERPTEVGIRRTCRGLFESECTVTQTTRYNVGRNTREAEMQELPNSSLRLLNTSADVGVEMEEKLVATKPRTADQLAIFSEIHNAIRWLNTPFTEEEERLLTQINSSNTPTEEDMRKLCQGFEGDCRVTETTRSSVQHKQQEVETNSSSEKIQEKLINPKTSNQYLETRALVGKNSTKPITSFTETDSAIRWLLTALNAIEEQLLALLASHNTPRDFTRTKRGTGKQRDKRFIKEFLRSLLRPNGRLEGRGREIVNADDNWTPKIPAVTVNVLQSEREQQNIYDASHTSYGDNSNLYSSNARFNEYNSDNQDQYFNEYSDASSNTNKFNEYNSKMNGQENEFDENSVGTNAYFNEYSSSNGREHQRWYDF